MKLFRSFHPFAFTTIFCWSIAFVVTKLALLYFSPFGLAFARHVVASCALLVIAVILKMKPPAKKDLPLFVVAGSFGFFLYFIFFNQGQGMVTAATGSLIIATVPVITALLARFVYKEKLRAIQWAAMGIEFAGVALMSLMNGVVSLNFGVVWLICAAISVSSYNIVQRKLTKSYSAVQTAACSIFAGTCLLSIFSPAAVSEAAAAPAIAFVYLCIMGCFSSAIAYVTWAAAFARAKHTSDVTNYMFLGPFITVVLEFLFLGTLPDTATLAGGALVLTGVAIFNFSGNKK